MIFFLTTIGQYCPKIGALNFINFPFQQTDVIFLFGIDLGA